MLWRGKLTYHPIDGTADRTAEVVLAADTRRGAEKEADAIARTFWKQRLAQDGGDVRAKVELFGSQFVLIKGAE
jgi:hypothetical protein